MAGGNLPWIVVRGLICEHFHIPPSVLDEQDADEMFQMWNALNKYHEYRNRKGGG